MEDCCLCKSSVSSGQEKKRRKKLHGAACKGARDALNAELQDALSLHLDDFVDTSAANSFLCKSCDGTLDNIIELQNHLSRLRDTVKGYISGLKPMMAAVGTKRNLSSASTASPPKRMCLDTATPGTSQSTSPAVTVCFPVNDYN